MSFDKQDQKKAYIRLGLRIRHRREALGMSEGELGQRIGLSITRVQACERGRHVVYATLLETLAKALDTSISYLLQDEVTIEEKKRPSHSPISEKLLTAHLLSLDIHIGHRLRERRKALGFSQERLGRELGITFQQIQKYEKGSNSLSTRRLYQLTHALDVPISFFFNGFTSIGSEAHADTPDDLNLALARACGRIESPKVKAAFVKLIKVVAKITSVNDDDVILL